MVQTKSAAKFDILLAGFQEVLPGGQPGGQCDNTTELLLFIAGMLTALR